MMQRKNKPHRKKKPVQKKKNRHKEWEREGERGTDLLTQNNIFESFSKLWREQKYIHKYIGKEWEKCEKVLVIVSPKAVTATTVQFSYWIGINSKNNEANISANGIYAC